MKSFLCVLGVGLPILLMMAGWSLLKPHPTTPAASVETGRRLEASLPPGPAAVSSRPASAPVVLSGVEAETKPALTALNLIAGIDEWLAKWTDSLDREPQAEAAPPGAQLSQGQYEQALAAFDRTLARHPDDVTALLGKAMALTGLERHEDALPLYEAVLRRNSTDSHARFNYGVALMRTGHASEAVAVFQSCIGVNPADVRSLFNLAVTQQASGLIRDALITWRLLTGKRDLLERLPPRARIDAWSHRGEVAMSLYAADEAEHCFLAVTRLDPTDPSAWCNVGIARTSVGRRDEAADALKEALRLDPRFVPALNQMALLMSANYRDTDAAEHRDAAISWCERSLQVQPLQENIRSLRAALRATITASH